MHCLKDKYCFIGACFILVVYKAGGWKEPHHKIQGEVTIERIEMKFLRRIGYYGKTEPLLHTWYEPTKHQNWLSPEEETTERRCRKGPMQKKKNSEEQKMLLILLHLMSLSLKGHGMDLDGVSHSISLPSEPGSTSAWRTRYPRPKGIEKDLVRKKKQKPQPSLWYSLSLGNACSLSAPKHKQVLPALGLGHEVISLLGHVETN